MTFAFEEKTGGKGRGNIQRKGNKCKKRAKKQKGSFQCSRKNGDRNQDFSFDFCLNFFWSELPNEQRNLEHRADFNSASDAERKISSKDENEEDQRDR